MSSKNNTEKPCKSRKPTSRQKQKLEQVEEIKLEEIMVNHTDTRCRTCLKDGTVAIINNPNIDLVTAIKTFAQTEICSTDELPKVLCNTCYNLLCDVIQFRDTAQRCDLVLREEISLVKKESEDNHSVHSYSEINNLDEKFTITDEKEIANNSQDTSADEDVDNPVILDKIDLKESIKTVKAKKLQKQPKTEKVECNVCKKSISKSYYTDHLARHGFGTPKQRSKTLCKLCNKNMDRAYYKHHMDVVHQKEHSKFICHVCGKTYSYKSGYNNHLLTHKDEFPFKCTLCPYRGRHSGLLSVHMRTHTRDYKYQCTDCSASFLTNGNLHKHMRKHKEHTFKCTECTKGFHSAGQLQMHVKVDHMGVKNHVCSICDKAFGYRSAMMKHQLHVHKRKKFVNGRMPSYLKSEANQTESQVVAS